MESNGPQATNPFALHLVSSPPFTQQLCKLKGREGSRDLGWSLRVNTHKRGKRKVGLGSLAAAPTLDTKHPFPTHMESKSRAPWSVGCMWGHSGSQHWEAQGQQGKSMVQLGQITSERAQYKGLPETKQLLQTAAFGHRDCLLWGTTEGRCISSGHTPCPVGGCGAREPSGVGPPELGQPVRLAEGTWGLSTPTKGITFFILGLRMLCSPWVNCNLSAPCSVLPGKRT